MASEIRVNKINSQTGVGTITLSPTGVDISGVTTASTLRATTGIITTLQVGTISGDGSALTGVASTENIRTNTNATFLQNVNVSGTSTIGGDVNIADKIVHTGDTDTAIRFSAADTISIETGGVTRATVSGNNIDFPDAGTLRFGASNDLQIYHGTGGASNIIHSNTSQPLIINASGAGAIRLDTNSTERLRITSAGSVGIGSNNPAQILDIASTAPNIRFTDTVDGHSEIDGNAADLKFNADKGNTKADSKITFFVDNDEKLRITSTGTVQFRNINTAAETDNVTQVNWIGPHVYQHSKTVTATTNGSGAVTFDLGCPFYYDGTTFEYFINASPTDNTNFTTTYQKGFFTKARGGGLGQFEVIKNDSAKAGCSLGTPTAGNPSGHQFNIAISGAVANKQYRATILYTGISRYSGY